VISRLIYPLLVGGAMAVGVALLGAGYSQSTTLAAVMLPFLVLLTLAERTLPFDSDWNTSHGDIATDSIHTVVTSVLLPRLYWPGYALAVSWATGFVGSRDGIAWPSHWPAWSQVVLALVVTEFVWYWLHRLGHETDILWRLHSVHHSVQRQYWLNGSRDHPIAVVLFALVVVPLLVLGCPTEIITLYLLFNGAHGAFQHANVDARLGPLNWVVSMSELHRWHHSTVLEEANANYGHNLILWDIVFRTRKLPARRQPAKLGIADMPAYPGSYLAQLAVPFRWKRLRSEARDSTKEQVA
jgi:sterol desaturase/sphingolipid hydroxylase (fatty acid hydroxylase superfamily)